MSTVTKPVILNETGVRMADALEIIAGGSRLSGRVIPLGGTALDCDNVFEANGIPEYVDDVTQYAAYGISDAGWYIFVRIMANAGVTVSAQTSVTGADGSIVTVGNGYVDVAVRFEVAALGKRVTVTWGDTAEVFVFRATDLAVRNLDYRTTFYVYDVAPYAVWSYALTTDTAFVTGSHYYTLIDGAYVEAVEGTDWTAADAIPAYNTLDGETYTQATGTFADGETYYTKSGETYTEAEVTVGEAIPAYYKHSGVTFSGMVKNVTYKCDTPIDCGITVVLPEIPEGGHGAWFEFQLRHLASGSITLSPPTGVKGATAGASAAITAGMNVVDLHYTNVNGVKMWSLANVHTNIT